MPFICIKENSDAPSIFFPVHEELTLDDLRTAFPHITSLRYEDSGNGQIHHILCRNGVFVEPEGGWGKSERIFCTVCDTTWTDCLGNSTNLIVYTDANAARSSLFDTYRSQLSNRQKASTSNARAAGSSSSTVQRHHERPATVMVHVGIGRFRNGVFRKISAHSLSATGGQVVVGPFPKSTNTVEAIKMAAFEKFRCLNRSFRNTYTRSERFSLVYNDGTIIDKLPDNSGDFSIEGYRNFLNPKLKYDRIRFFLCEKADLQEEGVEIVTDSSSSSDDLPELTSSRQQQSDSMDSTLPLVMDVSFYIENEFICNESFPNNSAISILLKYLSDGHKVGSADEGETVTLKFHDRCLRLDERLIEVSATSHVRMDVEINKTSDGASNDDGIEDVVVSSIPGDFFNNADVQNGIVKKTLDQIGNRREPVSILRCYRDNFLRGRPLDVDDVSTCPTGETACIFVGRNSILNDMTTEILEVHNLRFPLEVNFYGEESEDFGGPRKEFFRLAEEAIKTRLCEEDGNLKLDDLHVASKTFYVAGIVLGLSAIQGGPCSPIVAYATSPLDTEAHDTEAHEQFRQGLRRVGILQLLERKPTFRHLFTRARQDLTVQQLLTLLEADFSEAGSSNRLNEERTYRMFVKYVRNVAAGRQPGISLGKILSFVTGSEEVPILGFSISPTLSFVELPGGFPTATTCTNHLNLPLNLVEGEMFEKLSMAFMSQYFGMR